MLRWTASGWIASVGLALSASNAPGQVAFLDLDGKPPARVFIYFEPPPAVTAPAPSALPAPGPSTPAPAPTPTRNPAPPAASTPTPTPTPPSALPARTDLPPMGQVLLGGRELTREEITLLRRAPGPEAKPGVAHSVEAYATMVVVGASGTTKSFRISRGPQAEFFADGDALPKTRVLKAEFITPIADSWTCFAGPWDAPPALLKLGQNIEVPAALHRPASIFLDNTLLRQRGLDAPRMAVKPAERTLGDSAIYLRLPANYSPRKPVGLLVWIDPSDAGLVPPVVTAAADKLGFAVVGVSKNGNDRNLVDRAQRTLDAVATTLPLVHIDRDRVYATGMSGGGRMSSIMAACFPETFTGSVSMAGIAHYRDLPTPDGKVWPAYFRQPTGKRWSALTKHRMASITGTHDFNHQHSLATCKSMEADGLEVLPWIVPVIGHELPPADKYLEALTWVDETHAADLAKRAKAADEALGKMPEMDGAVTDDQRKALYAIMEQAPWSPAAWKAAGLLGLTPKK